MAGEKPSNILTTDVSGNLVWKENIIWHSGNLVMSDYVKKTETMTRYANNEWRFLPTDYGNGSTLNVLFNYKSVTSENLTKPITGYFFYNGAGALCGVSASKFCVENGTNTQFLKGDGSLDSKKYFHSTAPNYLTGAGKIEVNVGSNGILVEDNSGDFAHLLEPTDFGFNLLGKNYTGTKILELTQNLRATQPLMVLLDETTQQTTREKGLYFGNIRDASYANLGELYTLYDNPNIVRLASLYNANKSYVNDFQNVPNKWLKFFYVDFNANTNSIELGFSQNNIDQVGGYIRGVTDIYFISDKRYKKNIKTYTVPKGLLDVKLKSYIHKDTEEHKIGYIAQEVREIAPDFVQEDKNGYLSIAYRELELALIEALKQEVKQLRKELNHIKAQTKKNRL